MVIRFVEPAVFNSTSECILKLYDRRFSNQLRKDWDAALWSPELEKEYQSFVARGEAEEYFSYWEAEKGRFKDWSAIYVNHTNRWSVAKREAYLQWEATDSYKTEKKAYEHMIDLQGEDVPKIFGEVFLREPSVFHGQNQIDATEPDRDEVAATQADSTSISSSEGDRDPLMTNVPGILKQYIDGFLLSDLHQHPPRDLWQSIIDTTIEKLNRVQACGIYNKDAQCRSFLVGSSQKIMMIDFNMVTFREDVDDDEDWDTLLGCPSQEGTLGMNMKIGLEVDTQHHIIYNPSEQYWRLKYRQRGPDGERVDDTVDEEEYVEKHKNMCFDDSFWIPSKKKA
jgi:hypothetical protein